MLYTCTHPSQNTHTQVTLETDTLGWILETVLTLYRLVHRKVSHRCPLLTVLIVMLEEVEGEVQHILHSPEGVGVGGT